MWGCRRNGMSTDCNSAGFSQVGSIPTIPTNKCIASLYAMAGWPLYPRKQASQTATRVLLARLDIAKIQARLAQR